MSQIGVVCGGSGGACRLRLRPAQRLIRTTRRRSGGRAHASDFISFYLPPNIKKKTFLVNKREN